jgi:hypothetical protein
VGAGDIPPDVIKAMACSDQDLAAVREMISDAPDQFGDLAQTIYSVLREVTSDTSEQERAQLFAEFMNTITPTIAMSILHLASVMISQMLADEISRRNDDEDMEQEA